MDVGIQPCETHWPFDFAATAHPEQAEHVSRRDAFGRRMTSRPAEMRRDQGEHLLIQLESKEPATQFLVVESGGFSAALDN